MKELVEQLGLDPEEFQWQDLALCSTTTGTDTELFFSEFESDPVIQKQVRDMCAVCPVRQMCFLDGVQNKEYGVRGGYYLENGKLSANYNDPDEVERINNELGR